MPVGFPDYYGGLTIPVTVVEGGTGQTALTSNAVLLGNGTGNVAMSNVGTANQVFQIPSGGGAPVFQSLAINSGALSGILPIANGGTGTSSPALVAGSNIVVSGSWPNQTIALASSVGIGTASPNAVLDVRTTVKDTANTLLEDTPTGRSFTFVPYAAAGHSNALVADGDCVMVFTGGTVDTGAFSLVPWATTQGGIRMGSDGKTGIGRVASAHLLEVNGGIAATSQMIAGTAAATSEAETFVSKGANSGYSIEDRAGAPPSQPRWVIYASGGVCNLWQSVNGQVVVFNANGNMNLPIGIRGIGNGTPNVALSAPPIGTGSGPTTPNQIVMWLQIQVAGATFWIPMAQ